MTAPPREPVAWGQTRYICDRDGRPIGSDDPILSWGAEPPEDSGWWPLYAAPAPSAAQPAEPTATDDLVARLRVRSINVWDAPFALRDEAADTIERQAREIAAANAECVKLRGWVNDAEQAAGKSERRAERAEAELHKANIDSANMMAECSDMSVDIEKYRREIAELKSELNETQRAGVTTANYWMERAELAEDQRERTRDVWATRAERAEAERARLTDERFLELRQKYGFSEIN